MHPLVDQLSNLKDEELHKKYSELSKRLSQCYRFGPQTVTPQLQMLMADYQHEIDRRQALAQEELKKKIDKDGRGFSDMIDIS